MAREYFCAYHSYLNGMKRLSDAECGRLFKALLEYSSAGEVSIKLQGREEVLFDVYSDQINRDIEAYEEMCRKNSQNGKAGGRPKKSAENPKNRPVFSKTQKSQDKDKEEDKDKDNSSKESVKRKAAPRFSPPTPEEVAQYCRERNNNVDAERFVDHYTACGWYIGKNPMKDWKAAVRTWEKNGFDDRRNTKADCRSSFDTDDFFNSALERTYDKGDEKD